MTDRELLGKVVRKVWLEWANEQPNPKPSWLLPWDSLAEPDKEVDRRIGEAIASFILEPMEQAVATLTREREEAIARAEKAEQEVKRLYGRCDDYRKEIADTEAQLAEEKQAHRDTVCVGEALIREIKALTQRADRAEAQLAEAQRALEIDRHALSAMQRDLDQARREVDRLQEIVSLVKQDREAALAFSEIQDRTDDDAENEERNKAEREWNAITRRLNAALNPPAEVEDEKHPQPNP